MKADVVKILAQIVACGCQYKADGERFLTKGPLPDELAALIREHKSDLLAHLRSGADRPRRLFGHVIKRVVWESPDAIIFQDEAGNYWRALGGPWLGQCWPIFMASRAQGAMPADPDRPQ